MKTYKDEIARGIAEIIKGDHVAIENQLSVPKDLSNGDLALPCFALAKKHGKKPTEFASFLASKLTGDMIEKAVAKGGYLNIFIRKNTVATKLISSILSEKSSYGSGIWGNDQVLVIDFSSPNIAKPFSMGHLRSTVIGHSLARLAEKGGYHVKRINHIGDWGTQFGKLMAAYKLWGQKEVVEADPIPELLKLYVRFHEEANEDPRLDLLGRAWFKKLEDKDPEAHYLWKWFRDVSLLAFNQTYELLGVTFDSSDGEAFYNDKMDQVVSNLRSKGLLEKSEGAYIVPLGDVLPPCLIQKSDGTSLYATRDLAAAIYRKEHYHFEKAFYVVGHEQSVHFQQVFKVLEKMGYDWADQLSHVDFGMMLMNGKKMSTRKGDIVRLDDVLKQAISKAKENILLKNPNLENKDLVAKWIGTGAVIFNDLKHTPGHDIEFSLDDMLSFDGETGPYLQYTHARASSLLRKGGGVTNGKLNVKNEWEWGLVVKLSQFDVAIFQAFDQQNPSKLARYLLKLGQQFNKYYAQVRILEENEEKQGRLMLVNAFQITLKEGLRLLGIEAPDEM